MVLVGLFFLYGKTAGVHAGHGVVGKKQSVFGDKGWFGKRMVLLLKIVMV